MAPVVPVQRIGRRCDERLVDSYQLVRLRHLAAAVNCNARQQQSDEPSHRLANSRNVAKTTVVANRPSASCRVAEYLFVTTRKYTVWGIHCNAHPVVILKP